MSDPIPPGGPPAGRPVRGSQPAAGAVRVDAHEGRVRASGPLSTRARTLGYVVRSGPWWSAAVVVYFLGVARNPWAGAVGAGSVLVAGAVASALIWVGVAVGMGYAPITVDQLPGDHLVHLSQAPAVELLVPGCGQVRLDPVRCRRMSRMVRVDRPWHRWRPAVYFFVGEPTRADVRANVAQRARAKVIVAREDVQGPLYRRWDGCIAIPHGYRGPGQVHEVDKHGGVVSSL